VISPHWINLGLLLLHPSTWFGTVRGCGSKIHAAGVMFAWFQWTFVMVNLLPKVYVGFGRATVVSTGG